MQNVIAFDEVIGVDYVTLKETPAILPWNHKNRRY